MSLEPRGSWEFVLTFSPSGEFTRTVSTYGVYAGTSATERVAEAVVTGTCSLIDDRLRVSSDTYSWWDTFYDDPGPHHGEPPANLYADCTIEIMRSVLTLRYTTYPADAPVETTTTLARIR
jgi:hypothetical protein